MSDESKAELRRQRAETLVWGRAREQGRERPTGDDAREVLDELLRMISEIADIAMELDRPEKK